MDEIVSKSKPVQLDMFSGMKPKVRSDWDDRAVELEVLGAFRVGLQYRSNYPMPPQDNPYNGAPSVLRREGGDRIRAAVRMKLIPVPLECSICCDRPGKRIHYHSENYYRALACKPICPPCHRILHKRFDNPWAWQRLIEKHKYEGAWFVPILMRELTKAECLKLAELDNPIDPRQLVTVRVRRAP